MTQLRRCSPLLLTLLLMALPASSQSTASGASEPEQASPEAEDTPSTSRETAQDKDTASTSSDSPFDYRASEEISEDVPVSFPVDI